MRGESHGTNMCILAQGWALRFQFFQELSLKQHCSLKQIYCINFVIFSLWLWLILTGFILAY